MFGLSQLWERVILVGVILLLAAGLAADLEYRGYKRCEKGVDKSNAIEVKREDIQHGKDQIETGKEGKDFATAKTEYIAPAPVIRLGVCPTLHYKTGEAPAATGPGTDAGLPVRAEDQGLPASIEWDTKPIVQAGHDADAQVKGLKDYILNVCRPGAQ